MPIKDFCNRKVVCISPDATVSAAARLMKQQHVGELVVMQKPEHRGSPLGVLTDRDLVIHVLAEGIAPDETRVRDVMMLEPRALRGSDGVLEATEAMEQTGIRRLPVIDDDGNLTGIVSADDLYDLLATEFSNLARISARQIMKEGTEPRAPIL